MEGKPSDQALQHARIKADIQVQTPERWNFSPVVNFDEGECKVQSILHHRFGLDEQMRLLRQAIRLAECNKSASAMQASSDIHLKPLLPDLPLQQRWPSHEKSAGGVFP